MSDVSCRGTAALLEAAARCDLPAETVLAGTDLDIDVLQDPDRSIFWDEFLQLVDRLETLGGDDLLERLGRELRCSTWNRGLALFGRFIWREGQFWNVLVRRVAPSIFRCLSFHYEELGGGQYRLVARIPSSQRGSEAFFRILTGLVRAGPSMPGRDETRPLTLEVRPRLGIITVQSAVAGRMPLRWLRSVAGALVGVPVISALERRDRKALRTASELERRNRSLATLQAVADSITHSLDFGGTAQRIVDAVAENTEFKGVVLYARSEDGHFLGLAARHDPGGRAGTKLPEVLPLVAGLGGDGFDPERIAWVASEAEHHELHPEIRRRLGELGMQAAAVVPLRFHDQTLGALGLASARIRSFDAEDEAALLALGKTAAAALMAARHVAEMEREVRERRRVERALRESEERLREVAENVEGVFYLLDAQTDRVLYLSPSFERLTGHPKDAITKDIRAILEWVHPDDRERLIGVLGATGEPTEYEAEFRMFRADGSLIHLRDRQTLIRDDDGVPVRILGFAQDVTLTRDLEHQLRHSRKMEAVGRLAGGIAHDFNNLLTVISGHGEVLRDRFDDDDPAGTGVEEILRATQRASALTRRLLTLARKQPTSAESLELGSLIEELAPMLRSLLGETVSLELELAPEPLPVRIDRSQLEQVVMNIAVNARDAMPGGGTFSVETRNLAAAGVGLVMRDTGHGMDPEVEARVFEPFFSTKDPGQGTGLGLATTLGIIEQARGRISVESAPGRGSCFRVELPREELHGDLPAPAKRPAAGGSETLLLVEDQDQVRAVASRTLRERGYRVIECRGGDEALVRGDDPDLALLVTDVVMPGMSGPVLARRMAALRPELPVLYLSGYTGEEMPEGAEPPGAFLPKPFTSESLAAAVRSCLDAALDS